MDTLKFNTDVEKSVFEEVFKDIPELIKTKCGGYDELYGYKLNPEDEDKANVEKYYREDVAKGIVYKLCKAYKFERSEIISNFISIMRWRADFNPLSAAFLESHDKELQEVGILTSYPAESANKKIVTWNLYGQLVKKKHLFEDVEKFLRYRIGLMERGLRLLDFNDESNCYMTQVHDYKGVSVFKTDGAIKKCTKQVIHIFQKYYPELLYAKYFVNVPSFFGLVYDVVKKFVDAETMKKFVVLSDGAKLGRYLKSCPKTPYGGSGEKKTLQQENFTDVRPTEYGQFILERSSNQDID
ncbi:hypothetical protein HG535_0C00730 [Zygotorulaspora mrakii]|uniref:Phosphatidylinositol transfer protein SFH5 n=1 Tax=Zygotorulaspora mrakii TaxID=42260 RepID=A0A7H9B057_ZYGMR|nr:uncharacterized protein HG535_0C00730 [Zygotorulaspora mrakii]QLG71724.1 hypothetical protein HG535_0C00730 [Zygotorulaspora mrakii]